MKYHQITLEERYRISALRQTGLGRAGIARELGRHRSTISRELRRNRSRWDGRYRPSKAQDVPGRDIERVRGHVVFRTSS